MTRKTTLISKLYLVLGPSNKRPLTDPLKCTFCDHQGICETFQVWQSTTHVLSSLVLKYRICTYQLHVRPGGSRHNGAGDPCGVAFACAIRALDLEWDEEKIDIEGYLSAFDA